MQGQMQLTTIEGDYRKFEPSSDVEDILTEEPRKVISEETAEGNEEGMKDGLEVEKTFQDMSEKKEDTVPNIIINESDGNFKADNENVTGIFYDLERIKIPLPCSVNETVYFYDGDSIKEGIINQITLRKAVKTQFRVYVAEDGSNFFFEVSDFGSFLFYTYEEAERIHNKIPDKCVGFHYIK